MNERIGKLAKQAYEDVIKHTPSFLVTKELYEQKFAELILQDVMSICEDLGDKGMDGHYCVDKIRKEFGV